MNTEYAEYERQPAVDETPMNMGRDPDNWTGRIPAKGPHVIDSKPPTGGGCEFAVAAALATGAVIGRLLLGALRNKVSA